LYYSVTIVSVTALIRRTFIVGLVQI